ncbi:MAG: ABC transporter permease subunit [Nakamurella sp.]
MRSETPLPLPRFVEPAAPPPPRQRTGPGGRRRGRRPALPRGLRIAGLLAPALLVIAVFFLAGVTQTVAQSFGYQPFLARWELSWDAYRTLATDPAVRASLLLTARIAIIPTVLAAGLGVSAALAIRRLGRSGTWVGGIVQTTLAVPHLVAALCMLVLLSQGGFLSRLSGAAGFTASPAQFPALTGDDVGWGIIASYVWKETAFLTVVALAALGRGVQDLENAARSLGATGWQRLVYITLPVIAPAVGSASVLVFAFTAGSYEVPALLGRPYPAALPVVALQYYRATDLTARPVAMAVAVLITVLSVVVVAVNMYVGGRLARRAR